MKKLILAFSLVFTFGFTLAACDDSGDAIITCDRYDSWLASCDTYCSMSVACEDNYVNLDPAVQLQLDDCADNVLINGVCAPTDANWSADIQACVNLGEQYLGIVCNYGPVCGDGTCEGDENEVNCPDDCAVAPVCGDGTCEGDENETNCPDDCAVDTCGDSVCDTDESPSDCPEDCSYVLCDDYDVWLGSCFTDCAAEPTCEDQYEAILDQGLLDDLDYCADALATNADDGVCDDVLLDGTTSCDQLLEDNLGSVGSCTFKK